MRGDRPSFPRQETQAQRFTPHARGSTLFPSRQSLPKVVYPACAGIDRPPFEFIATIIGLPRMRGDRPLWATLIRLPLLFTPHARGSTAIEIIPLPGIFVYPACAGIDPQSPPPHGGLRSLPRMRGDRPINKGYSHSTSTFTPHARGSTECGPFPCETDAVYPACAGIDLQTFPGPASRIRLPRMRGDRPLSNLSM